MKEVWQRIVELYRYWKAGRDAVKKAHDIINGVETKTFRETFDRLKRMVTKYGIEPNEELAAEIVKTKALLDSMNRQIERRTGPNYGKYQPPKK